METLSARNSARRTVIPIVRQSRLRLRKVGVPFSMLQRYSEKKKTVLLSSCIIIPQKSVFVSWAVHAIHAKSMENHWTTLL